MNCPKCGDILKRTFIEGIAVEECEECKGVWFDRDELRKANKQIDSDLNLLEFDIWKDKNKIRATVQRINCPKCGNEMVTLNYSDTNVVIDYCKDCGGIWLDKGEFKNIIDYLEEELLTKPFSEYCKATIEDAKEIITGHESFISEWKDFATLLKFIQYRILVDNPTINEIIIDNIANPFNH